ncbi:hypothetical protein ASE92_07185 [Pedobacter sp. Leaf41]|uniref:hypothetical protein n=1 Tax=Pedobacter sp. Leaf41 TaxID=1736218 RepID=UPI000702891F|nr:hypothetical protein [Pedobacter sp. Leaf41]KQN35917.1 hypothetical protein ASE92_07185 [Pedobacter sp. Leaf41]
MSAIKTLLLLCFTFLLISCSSQEKESYWKVNDIYRENKEPFRGLNGDLMQEVVDYNFHFIKRNDSLFFELPEKFTIDIKKLKNFRQLQIPNKDYYEIYANEFDGDAFKIKFKDNATLSDSKNTILEFTKLSKEKYVKSINDAVLRQKEMQKKVENLKLELVKNPQIVLNPITKLPQKTDTLINNQGREILIKTPKEIEIKESGDLKNQVFGNIKIGTLKDRSIIYDLHHKENDFGLKQLTIWMSTDTTAFNMDSFLARQPNILTYKRDKNSVVGYEIVFDESSNQAVVQSLFCLKYYQIENTHIFIYGDAYRSQMKNVDNKTEMNKILNFNYLLSENISIAQ